MPATTYRPLVPVPDYLHPNGPRVLTFPIPQTWLIRCTVTWGEEYGDPLRHVVQRPVTRWIAREPNFLELILPDLVAAMTAEMAELCGAPPWTYEWEAGPTWLGFEPGMLSDRDWCAANGVPVPVAAIWEQFVARGPIAMCVVNPRRPSAWAADPTEQPTPAARAIGRYTEERYNRNLLDHRGYLR